MDNSNGMEFVIPSTVKTAETATRSTSSGQEAKKDKKPARRGSATGESGGEYPVFHVEISSSSHPFYTGEVKVLDTAGRVERFKAKQAKAKAKK